MKSNGKQTTCLRNDFQMPDLEQTKNYAVVKSEQTAQKITAKLALMKQQQDLQMEKLLTTVAAINSARPVIDAVMGDPNANLHRLTEVILQRGVDIAEDFVEIQIDDEG